jgi:hypothetical protein
MLSEQPPRHIIIIIIITTTTTMTPHHIKQPYRQDPFSLEYPESSQFPGAPGAVGEDELELPRVECVSHAYPTRTVFSCTQ